MKDQNKDQAIKPPKPLNPRQEKFAQLIAQGIPSSHAYVQAGYAKGRPGARANSCYLMKVPRMAARIAEIQDLAASLETTLLTIAEKRRFLAEAVRTPGACIGPDSWLLSQDLHEITTTKAKTLRAPSDGNPAETATEAATQVQWRRAKMPDKLRAIELDSKLAGHFSNAGVDLEEHKREWEAARLKEIQDIAARVKIVSPLLMRFERPPTPPVDEGRESAAEWLARRRSEEG